LDADRALSAAEQLSAIPSRLVLEQVLGMFAFARDKLRPENMPSYRAAIARIVKPRFAALGLLPKAGQSPTGEEKLLRSSLVRALAFEAKDPALLRELSALGRAQLAAPPNGSARSPHASRAKAALAELPSELIDAALSVALREGDAARLAQAAEKLFTEHDGVARGRLLSAISSIDRPELTEQVLNLSLDPRLRTNERLGPLYGQTGREETRAAAYAWVKQHFDAFVAVLSEHQRSALIGASAGFCSEEMTRDVQAFFEPRAPKLVGGPRELAMTLESIRLCAALEKAQGDKVRAYFAGASEKPARPR
jgi:alanyl aminopeptidase